MALAAPVLRLGYLLHPVTASSYVKVLMTLALTIALYSICPGPVVEFDSCCEPHCGCIYADKVCTYSIIYRCEALRGSNYCCDSSKGIKLKRKLLCTGCRIMNLQIHEIRFRTYMTVPSAKGNCFSLMT
ncbi:hypothetical protein VNO77_27661 [Canavalia gladiata]|uniref:Uncharacterized protein n=1 Tax=Canavalia gladiata TaxID=3824 RepID=A0AAN9Q793_CANGL